MTQICDEKICRRKVLRAQSNYTLPSSNQLEVNPIEVYVTL